MSGLLAFPLMSLAVILQTTVFSRVTLLQGPADLVLLTMAGWILLDRGPHLWLWPLVGGLLIGIFSAVPFWLPVLTYTIATGVTLGLKRRVWQVPIIALFTAVFIGTIITTGIPYLFLSVQGIPLDALESINLILIPSLILNLILAIPVQAVLKEISRLVSTTDLEAEA